MPWKLFQVSESEKPFQHGSDCSHGWLLSDVAAKSTKCDLWFWSLEVLEQCVSRSVVSESHLVNNFVSTDNNKIFKYLKSITKSNNNLPIMSFNSSSASTDSDKASLFNKCFHSVFHDPSSPALFGNLLTTDESLSSSHLSFKHKLETVYTTSDTAIPHNNSHKDLGVILSDNLSLEKYYKTISVRAYKVLGLICRTVLLLIPPLH